jgi:hypothetical protein
MPHSGDPSGEHSSSSFPCLRSQHSRLINHSCDPSASAKIITINGQSKVSPLSPWPGHMLMNRLSFTPEHNYIPDKRFFTTINFHLKMIRHYEYRVSVEQRHVEDGSIRALYIQSSQHSLLGLLLLPLSHHFALCKRMSSPWASLALLTS